MTAVELRRHTVDAGFPTVFGRELIQELPNFVHRPYIVVTMADLWPGLEHHFDGHLAAVHEVTTIEVAALDEQIAGLPEFAAVVGLGGLGHLAVKFAAAVVNNECSAHAVIPGPRASAEPGIRGHRLCNSAALVVMDHP